ncbi:hypothetical protein N7474_010012 [Penicillium riverlandense]|uniref:uncharacterized protein n=1 Tax=Penicillium riverlandense TaxID=1903569 RepID=UPI0025484FA0|nr:uncharacterized protein N7474_010012 [Penicillium riverlandense]KAJ5808743.1 hypothetical protein N7474_010012 [Penicillium riverlandense]
MHLPSAFLTTRALLAGLVGSGDSSLEARDEVNSSAQFVDVTGEGTQCWLHLNQFYGCTGSSNVPIGAWGEDGVCVGSGVVSEDICDTASISVDFDDQTVTFYNPAESQLDIDSWVQNFANNQTVNY